MKKCVDCGETDQSKFYPYRRSYCRPCNTVRAKKWADKNPQKAADKVWEYNIGLKYGITRAEYDLLLEAQAGGCAICGTKVGGRVHKRMSVDHDHGTGKVRGLLCLACNKGLGRFRDDTELLAKAMAYLKNTRGN